MNLYASRKSVSGGSIVFTVLFFLVFIGAGYLFFIDKGLFWDYLPIICIPSLVITLILLTFYFVKRNSSGYIFTIFFLIFLSGMILSSIFGPFALINSATGQYSGKQYTEAITNYKKILDTYPNSKYAKEALINISDSYYHNGDYREAIFYYEKSINDNIIDGETLDIKKIFADSNLKIADSYYAAKDFSNAGDYYQKSVGYFEQIIQKFPETNDAFIAKYKIPEYLFMAADCLKNEKNWESSAAILKNIIDKYPESDFSLKSYRVLFNIYIGKALDIKENGEFRNSVIEFFKIYDLGDDLLDLVQSEINYSQNNLLAGIPQNFLVQAANDFYKLAEYKKSLMVYDYFLANYPDNEYMIIDNLVNIKIKTISEKPYDSIPEFTAAGSFAKSGNSRVTLDNRTEFNITVYLGGTENRVARLEKKTKAEVEIIAGSYKIVVEIQNPENGLLYGEASFEDGKKYKNVYTLTAE
jgi:outer membrane protein assembly factor BamD (BamD/ComL family)